SADYYLTINPGAMGTVWLRLSNQSPAELPEPFEKRFAEVIRSRRSEADEFYRSITPPGVGDDAALVMRQALAGMLWSEQFFFFDVATWLEEHGSDSTHRTTCPVRNSEWFHMVNQHIISMPDKWEYPWYAAWDLAFHTLALATVDLDFAKEQLDLLMEQFF